MLQKSPSMFLGLIVIVVEGLDALREGVRREQLLRAARDIVIWGLVAVAVYVLAWPVMWVNRGTVKQVLDKAIGYAEEGHKPGSYFFGKPVHDPGWLFYPVTLVFRLSPLALVGLIAGGVWVARPRRKAGQRFRVAALLTYSVLYLILMNMGAKKLDRYVLPVMPALDIVAAMGLLWVVEAAWRRLRGSVSRLRPDLVLSVTVVVVQIVLVAPHYPYYLTLYNPLLGGIRQAVRTFPVGWGEGYELAAAYLNSKPGAEQFQVAQLNSTIFAPQFAGRRAG